MRETIYSSVHNLKITNKGLDKILNIVNSEKVFEKREEIPTEILVIYCDCSNRSLEDDPCDGFTMKEYPNIIFVDPNGRADTMEVIAHELIHIIQEKKYFLFNDEYEEAYRQRWWEKMAFKLEKEVLKVLKTSGTLELITNDEVEIEDIMISNFKDDIDYIKLLEEIGEEE